MGIRLALPLALLTAMIVASSARAEELTSGEWLINGSSVTTATAATASGEEIYEDTKAGIGVVCSAKRVETLNESGLGEVAELLTLAGAAVSLTSPLLCKSHKFCEESTTDIEWAPEKLPWKIALTRTESGALRLSLQEVSYFESCLVLGIKTSEECTISSASSEVKNVTGGVESVGSLSPNGTCTIGGADSGEVAFVSGNLMAPTGGGTLTASSELVVGSVKLVKGEYNFLQVKLMTTLALKLEFESTTSNVTYLNVGVGNLTNGTFTKGKVTCNGAVAKNTPCEIEVSFQPTSPNDNENCVGELFIEYKEGNKLIQLKELLKGEGT
jgi:hypothetical protein